MTLKSQIIGLKKVTGAAAGWIYRLSEKLPVAQARKSSSVRLWGR